jgi:hypothetical protein
MKYFIISCAAFVFLMACNPLKQANRNAAKNEAKNIFPEELFDSIAAKNALALGNVTIEGVAFTKPREGFGQATLGAKNRIYAVNQQVHLFPVTPYFEAWYKLRKKKENSRTHVYLSDEAYRYRITVNTDQYGRFKFTQMKPGKYFMQIIIPWSESKTATVYEGSAYGSYGGRADYYSKQNYNVSHADRVEEYVTIGKESGTVQVKLK